MTRIIGYTTIEQENTSKQLTGLELAKRDLLNHFSIRKGEKWTNPEFGSNLPYYVFQPLDSATVDLITQDVFDVVSNDPRFEVLSEDVKVDNVGQSVIVEVQLMYLPTTTATDLQIKFDREFQEEIDF
jgi:phage baseplate assembly protein W